MSGRLYLPPDCEAGKKSACCAQPRLICQPMSSSPPAEAISQTDGAQTAHLRLYVLSQAFIATMRRASRCDCARGAHNARPWTIDEAKTVRLKVADHSVGWTRL